MMYQGGKTQIAKPILEIITATPGHTYVEPFLGSAATFHLAASKYDRSIGSDAQVDLVMMWQAAINGWIPPETLSREEYAELRHAEPSALRAFAGFSCSFAGKWFDGYASNGRGDDYAGAASRSIVKRATGMREAGARVENLDYREAGNLAAPGVVIYCDPPYANTRPYAGVGAFDSTVFWRVVDSWCEAGARVFVSEYSAPEHWTEVLSIERQSSTPLSVKGARAVDKLFTR